MEDLLVFSHVVLWSLISSLNYNRCCRYSVDADDGDRVLLLFLGFYWFYVMSIYSHVVVSMLSEQCSSVRS